MKRLHESISAVCPILGVSIGRKGVPATVRIDPDPSATPAQIAAGQAIVDSFDWSAAAQSAWEEDQKPERKTLRQQAANAISDIDAFLAIASPTAGQVRDEVRRICQRQRAIIRRLIQID